MTDSPELSRVPSGGRPGIDTIAVLTFSYPRWDGDDAGVFVKRLVDAYQAQGCRGVVMAPYDPMVRERTSEHFPVSWVRYGILTRGQLAFGEGIVPKLRRRPWLILQAPNLLFLLCLKLIRSAVAYDAIHAQWLPAAIPAAIAASARRVPWIITARGEDVRLMRIAPVRWLLKPFLRRVGAIVTVSEGLAADLRESLGAMAPRIEIIPNGVQVPSLSPARIAAVQQRFDLSEGDRFLLAVGTVIPRKRLEIIINALPRIHPPNVKLLIVGRCDDHRYREELLSQAVAAGCAGRVVFTGPVAADDVAALQQVATVCVSASEFEGRPNALLEALSAGAVVCASDIAAHREIIKDRVNGFLFTSTEQLVAQLTRCLENDVSAIRLGARQNLQGLTWEGCADRYRDLLADLACSR